MAKWYDDVAGDVAHFIGWQLASHIVTRGISWANGRVPRGPIKGCHVAPQVWLFGCVKLYGGRGVRPPDVPHHSKVFTKSNPPTRRAIVLNKHMFKLLFKVETITFWREGRAGA